MDRNTNALRNREIKRHVQTNIQTAFTDAKTKMGPDRKTDKHKNKQIYGVRGKASGS